MTVNLTTLRSVCNCYVMWSVSKDQNHRNL